MATSQLRHPPSTGLVAEDSRRVDTTVWDEIEFYEKGDISKDVDDFWRDQVSMSTHDSRSTKYEADRNAPDAYTISGTFFWRWRCSIGKIWMVLGRELSMSRKYARQTITYHPFPGFQRCHNDQCRFHSSQWHLPGRLFVFYRSKVDLMLDFGLSPFHQNLIQYEFYRPVLLWKRMQR